MFFKSYHDTLIRDLTNNYGPLSALGLGLMQGSLSGGSRGVVIDSLAVVTALTGELYATYQYAPTTEMPKAVAACLALAVGRLAGVHLVDGTSAVMDYINPKLN